MQKTAKEEDVEAAWSKEKSSEGHVEGVVSNSIKIGDAGEGDGSNDSKEEHAVVLFGGG